MDFVVLPLKPGTVPEIEKAIVSKVAFKNSRVSFTCRLKHGSLAFVANMTVV